ncbi:MAG: histidine phosphatase family protein [Actinomycetota bacterium]
MPHSASAPTPSLILLVRHGATEWSVAGRHTGRTDLPLTDLGEQQSQQCRSVVEHWLDGSDPVVYTSPLIRATHTASLALPHYEAEEVPALLEYDYGNFEGLTTTQILERDPSWDLFANGCPGGENALQVSARCDSFIAKMERTAAGRSVVAFTHGHLSRILTARLLGLPASAAAGLWNDTASVAAINLHRGKLVLVGWNICAL